MDFLTRVRVEQGDQVQKSRSSREWADAQEMPAVGAKKLPLDGRSCGFCKNDKGLKLPLWRMDVPRREESCRGVSGQKYCKQALLAARVARSSVYCQWNTAVERPPRGFVGRDSVGVFLLA
ncbi:hypothetical protein NDU88_007086 [Pleurodeles waltl]|uniref:Uncharacterized protein n=1 Tax=Pleurodeles waltl TaxID=8319 RepID=A0AAV7UNE2_PLEWA|nr:hypothetical protein NDU88_007086 [Pleurodeles waltl]